MEAPQGAKDAHCKCGVKLYPLTGVIIMLYALWALWEKRYIRNWIIIIIIIYLNLSYGGTLVSFQTHLMLNLKRTIQ